MSKASSRLSAKRTRKKYERALDELASSVNLFRDTTLGLTSLDERTQVKAYQKAASRLQKSLAAVSDAEEEWSGVDSFWPDGAEPEEASAEHQEARGEPSASEAQSADLLLRIYLEISDQAELARRAAIEGCGPVESEDVRTGGRLHSLLPSIVDLLEAEMSSFSETMWAVAAVTAVPWDNPLEGRESDIMEIFRPAMNEDVRVFELRHVD